MKTLDWESKQRKARNMTNAELNYAIEDCRACVRLGIDDGYYLDEISVYRKELDKRKRRYGG